MARLTICVRQCQAEPANHHEDISQEGFQPNEPDRYDCIAALGRGSWTSLLTLVVNTR